MSGHFTFGPPQNNFGVNSAPSTPGSNTTNPFIAPSQNNFGVNAAQSTPNSHTSTFVAPSQNIFGVNSAPSTPVSHTNSFSAPSPGGQMQQASLSAFGHTNFNAPSIWGGNTSLDAGGIGQLKDPRAYDSSSIPNGEVRAVGLPSISEVHPLSAPSNSEVHPMNTSPGNEVSAPFNSESRRDDLPDDNKEIYFSGGVTDQRSIVLEQESDRLDRIARQYLNQDVVVVDPRGQFLAADSSLRQTIEHKSERDNDYILAKSSLHGRPFTRLAFISKEKTTVLNNIENHVQYAKAQKEYFTNELKYYDDVKIKIRVFTLHEAQISQCLANGGRRGTSQWSMEHAKILCSAVNWSRSELADIAEGMEIMSYSDLVAIPFRTILLEILHQAHVKKLQENPHHLKNIIDLKAEGILHEGFNPSLIYHNSKLRKEECIWLLCIYLSVDLRNQMALNLVQGKVFACVDNHWQWCDKVGQCNNKKRRIGN